tara:strand:- start:3294 stop:3677 length:384 start_codon:yes stop_codon:yes gene_type:complete
MTKSNDLLIDIQGLPLGFWGWCAGALAISYKVVVTFVTRERAILRLNIEKETDIKIDIFEKKIDEKFTKFEKNIVIKLDENRKYLSESMHDKRDEISKRNGVVCESDRAMIAAIKTIEKLNQLNSQI